MPRFKVMTWNVENLFEPTDETTAEDRQRYHNKLDLLAQVITQVDSDVVAFQEIGGAEELQDLQQVLGNNYPHHAASDAPDGRGIRVGFISKLAVDEREDIVDFPDGPALDIHGLNAQGETPPYTRMGRGALRLRVTKDGFTADVITTHLKSKLLTFPRTGDSSFSAYSGDADHPVRSMPTTHSGPCRPLCPEHADQACVRG